LLQVVQHHRGTVGAAGGLLAVLCSEGLEDHLGVKVVAPLAELRQKLRQGRRLVMDEPLGPVATTERHLAADLDAEAFERLRQYEAGDEARVVEAARKAQSRQPRGD